MTGQKRTRKLSRLQSEVAEDLLRTSHFDFTLCKPKWMAEDEYAAEQIVEAVNKRCESDEIHPFDALHPSLLRFLCSLGSLHHHCVKCVRDLTVGFCARSFGMEGLGKHYTLEHLEAWRRQAIYKWGNRPRGLEDDGSPPRYDPGYADVAPAAAQGPGSAPGKRRKGGSLYRGGLDQGPRPSPKRFRTGGSVSPLMYVQQPIPPHLQGAEPAEFMKNAVDAVRYALPQPTMPLRCMPCFPF